MQKTVEFKSGGLTLRGMMHFPDNIRSKTPMVCMYHGFTNNKMESHFLFVKLSRMLEAKGIASIRFDFAGSGESDGNFVDMTISKELEDAKAILNFAMSQEFVDISKIAILGLSMGGAVASMLAGVRKNDIQTLCLWAPAGNMAELVMRGRGEEEIQEIYKKGFLDRGGFLVGVEFLNDVRSLDIFTKVNLYNKNVLLLHGSEDITVPLKMSNRYVEIYKDRCRKHVIEGADHTFNSKEWEEEVLNYTLEYLEDELK